MIGQHVKIEKNELLSGWVHHLAERNGVSDYEFSKYLFGAPFYHLPNKGLIFDYEKYLPGMIIRLGESRTPDLSELLREHMTFTEGFPFSHPARQAELTARYLKKDSSPDHFLLPVGKGPFAPKICPVCAKEDLDRLGRIVLYTQHHLDSVTTCYKHHVKLIQTYGYPSAEDVTDPEPAEEEAVNRDVFAAELFKNGWRLTAEQMRQALDSYANAAGAADIYALIDAYDDIDGDKKAFRHWLASNINIQFPGKHIGFLARMFGKYEDLAPFLPQKPKFDDQAVSSEDYTVTPHDEFMIMAKCSKCGKEMLLTPAMLQTRLGCDCRHEGMSETEIIEEFISKQTDEYALDSFSSRQELYIRHIPCGRVRKSNTLDILAGKFVCSCGESAGQRVGEQNRNTLGLMMTIIRYRSSKDLDVRFENGTVIHHRTYTEFKNGKIGLPFRFAQQFIGQKSLNSDGYQMTIVGYFGNRRCVVSFQDGSKAVCSTMQFRQGKVTKPEKEWAGNEITFPPSSERLLETGNSKEGLTMTIVCFRDDTDIDVALETGEIVEHTSYERFLSGELYAKEKKDTSSYMEGRTGVSACGQTMRIVRYGNSRDIDVSFENGIVLQHVSYRAFINGTLTPDNAPSVKPAERVGMQIRSVITGQMMEILEYFTVNNVTVRFETGDIYYNKSYTKFKKGQIGNPEYVKRSRLHEKKLNKHGEMMEIIRYDSSQDIDVIFDDGSIAKHRQYGEFISGNIRNPNSPKTGKRH